jgi:hypothetical protein
VIGTKGIWCSTVGSKALRIVLLTDNLLLWVLQAQQQWEQNHHQQQQQQESEVWTRWGDISAMLGAWPHLKVNNHAHMGVQHAVKPLHPRVQSRLHCAAVCEGL